MKCNCGGEVFSVTGTPVGKVRWLVEYYGREVDITDTDDDIVKITNATVECCDCNTVKTFTNFKYDNAPAQF